MNAKTIKLIAVSGIGVFAGALSASAVPVNDECIIDFPFYKLKSPVAVGDFPSLDGVTINGDRVSSDVANGVFDDDLRFSMGGITATATGTYLGQEAAVVQDHESGWTATKGAGLGVYHEIKTFNDDGSVASYFDGSDDNITRGEVLTITFNQVVNIKSIGLRAEGHTVTWGVSSATFLFNGVAMALPEGTGSIPVDYTSNVISFEFGGADPDQFYVSSLGVACGVPDSGATLALFGLSLAGLGAVRRRLAK